MHRVSDADLSRPTVHWFQRLRRVASLDLRPLRASRDYRLLFLGQFVSAFGFAISYVVLPWQVYRLTHSTLLVGLLGLTEFVPMLAFALLGGALADAVDRRRLILLAEIGLGLACAALIANSLLAAPHVWVLFFAAALTASANAVHRPALESLTPQLVAPEHMPAVAALTTFRFSFNFIVGPALAGLIADHFGAATAYSVDLFTYGISIATLLLMRSVPVPAGGAPPGLKGVAEGLRYARQRPELLGTYLIDIIAMFFGMPIALFPAIAESFGGASVGLFYAALAVGPLLVTLTSGWTNRIHRHGLGVTWAVVVWGLAIVGFGVSHHLWLALAFLVVAGGADCVSGLFRMTMWNQTIPDRLRGRLAGIEMVSYLSGPYLGNAEAGLVASVFGLGASVVSGGILCVAGAGILAILLPRFIRYDSREGIALKNADHAAAALGAPVAPQAS